MFTEETQIKTSVWTAGKSWSISWLHVNACSQRREGLWCCVLVGYHQTRSSIRGTKHYNLSHRHHSCPTARYSFGTGRSTWLPLTEKWGLSSAPKSINKLFSVSWELRSEHHDWLGKKIKRTEIKAHWPVIFFLEGKKSLKYNREKIQKVRRWRSTYQLVGVRGRALSKWHRYFHLSSSDLGLPLNSRRTGEQPSMSKPSDYPTSGGACL